MVAKKLPRKPTIWPYSQSMRSSITVDATNSQINKQAYLQNK